MNLATTISGIKNALPVEDSLYQELKARGISLPPVIADLRDLKFETPIDVYEYLYKTYWKDCNKRLLISLSPRNVDFIRDLAVATGSAVVWLDVRKHDDSVLADRFFSDMRQGRSFVFGWWPEERSGVGLGTKHGIATVAADFFENATVFAGQSQQIELPAVPRMPELANKIYVTIYLSDGDNIQYCQHSLAKLWRNEKRGSVPINWTISPALFDAAPQILNYYDKTATDNDCFVSGPSGVGYALIYDVFNKRFNIKDSAVLDKYTRFSEPYLERSGLRAVTIWDDLDEKQMDVYAKNCRYLYGNAVHDWGKGAPLTTHVLRDRMPFFPSRPGYTGDIEQIYKKWRDSIQTFDGSRPMFLAAQGVAWRMTPENILALKERLDSLSPGNVVICRADHFFNLYNEANDHYFNLCLLPGIQVASRNGVSDIGKLTDGSPSAGHRWVASGAGPQQIHFDLKETFLIGRYVVRHAGAGGAAANLNTRSFKLETSTDDKNWKTVSVCLNNTADVSDLDITPVRARYVRLRIIDPGKDHRARIGEIEIYGKKTASAPGKSLDPTVETGFEEMSKIQRL
ncbi:MAG TPA: discoidin domain-containing protein, partial [Puia sp.]|nr:discoidin domain-containing protein [Puia sp.]